MRRPGIGALGPGWIGLPALGVLAYASPMAAAGVTGLVTSGIAYTLAQPLTTVTVTAFLVAAVPKAGVNVGAFPVPAMLFVLFAALPILRRSVARAARPAHPVGMLAFLALAWLGCRMAMMFFASGNIGALLALAGWYGLPIVLVVAGPAFGALRGEPGWRWATWMEVGVAAACAFSVLQQLVGIDSTVVPGITRSVGADYTRKPIQFAGGSKIPSTYQNGNILGVVTAFFFLVAANRFIGGRRSGRDKLVLALTAVATVLSGSRTVVIGMVIGLVVLVLRSRVSHRTMGVWIVLGASTLAILQFSPSLADRLMGTRANDPALEVRSVVWSDVLARAPVSELLFGGPTWVQEYPDPGLAEGMVGAVQQVGIVGMVLFVGVILVATSDPKLQRWRIMLIPVAISLSVDSAYLVFPTLFLPVARMFAPLYEEEPALDPVGAKSGGVPSSALAGSLRPVGGPSL